MKNRKRVTWVLLERIKLDEKEKSEKSAVDALLPAAAANGSGTTNAQVV